MQRLSKVSGRARSAVIKKLIAEKCASQPVIYRLAQAVARGEKAKRPYDGCFKKPKAERILAKLGLTPDFIDALLKATGETRVTLAKKIGCNVNTLGRLCQGERETRSLASALAENIEQLLRVKAEAINQHRAALITK